MAAGTRGHAGWQVTTGEEVWVRFQRLLEPRLSFQPRWLDDGRRLVQILARPVAKPDPAPLPAIRNPFDSMTLPADLRRNFRSLPLRVAVGRVALLRGVTLLAPQRRAVGAPVLLGRPGSRLDAT